MCRCSTAVLPWTFAVFVFLTSVLDFSGGTAAQEFSEWLASVSPRCEGHALLYSQLGAVWKALTSMLDMPGGTAAELFAEWLEAL